MERKCSMLYIYPRPKIINQGTYKKDRVFIMILSQCGGVQSFDRADSWLMESRPSTRRWASSECASLTIISVAKILFFR